MGDKIKEFWHDQIPGWFPLLVAIVGGAFWIGQEQQSINDRLRSVEIQIQSMQDYLRNDHRPPSSVIVPEQHSSLPSTYTDAR